MPRMCCAPIEVVRRDGEPLPFDEESARADLGDVLTGVTGSGVRPDGPYEPAP